MVSSTLRDGMRFVLHGETWTSHRTRAETRLREGYEKFGVLQPNFSAEICPLSAELSQDRRLENCTFLTAPAEMNYSKVNGLCKTQIWTGFLTPLPK